MAPPAPAYARYVEQAAKRLGVDLVCTGYLENSTARAIVGRAVALVHLSVSEGFGLAVAEAQAQGVVAVVGAVGGLVSSRQTPT